MDRERNVDVDPPRKVPTYTLHALERVAFECTVIILTVPCTAAGVSDSKSDSLVTPSSCARSFDVRSTTVATAASE